MRGYAQEGLALLTTRGRAYGYRTVERFLTEVTQAGGAKSLTDALARWTARLWKPEAEESQSVSLPYYVDGHRKPVFSNYLLPRGVIGRTGKVLGRCTLLLLHDAQGHPLLATTHRDDLHLTLGTPSLLSRYETATDEGPKVCENTVHAIFSSHLRKRNWSFRTLRARQISSLQCHIQIELRGEVVD